MVRKVFQYLYATKDYGIRNTTTSAEREVYDFDKHRDVEETEWRFYSDSDHAGNAEIQNKRRSQNGMVATFNGAPVEWYSKASSVAFATKDIGEAHADVSSASSEIYAAGNATFELMGLSYVIEEMGLVPPKPLILEIDNSAAIIFTQGNAQKTKLKHIDCQQEWVKTIRDKGILYVKHVSTKDNLADIFTKILDYKTFEGLRSMILLKKEKN